VPADPALQPKRRGIHQRHRRDRHTPFLPPGPHLLPALGLPYYAPSPTSDENRPGTGPYRIASYIAGKLIDLERNPYFHEWAPVAQPAGYPDRILIYSDGSSSADIAAVLSGRAGFTFDQPTPSQLTDIQRRSPGLLHAEPLPNTDWLDLNTRAAPFNDLRVRQALNDAVDRNAIAHLYGGLDDATPTCQIVPATIPGHLPYAPDTRPAPSQALGARRTSDAHAGSSPPRAHEATP